jgi:thiosulfate/3-mercaptopyruvate sulfurtransferase
VEVDWTRDLNDPVERDYLDKAGFEALMSRIGATRESTLVFYGDQHNWWATYAFWVFQLFGHDNAKVMDGGRLKWENEARPMTRERPMPTPTDYEARERDDAANRAFRDGVLAHVEAGKALIDVRSPEEYRGERLHMDGYPNEGALRGGHIPGAVNVPWARAVNPDDGTFRNRSQLEEIYREEAGIRPGQDVITYCRIGERSSHTWFVLKYLLGQDGVRNYDGSWTEWGNLVGAPIER